VHLLPVKEEKKKKLFLKRKRACQLHLKADNSNRRDSQRNNLHQSQLAIISRGRLDADPTKHNFTNICKILSQIRVNVFTNL
jgi:hypothetical protein